MYSLELEGEVKAYRQSLIMAQIAAVMVDFEKQFENVDSATELYQDVTSSATAVAAPASAASLSPI